MFLTRQIKVRPDDAAEIPATENGRTCSIMDLSVVTGVLVQPTCGTGLYDLIVKAVDGMINRPRGGQIEMFQ